MNTSVHVHWNSQALRTVAFHEDYIPILLVGSDLSECICSSSWNSKVYNSPTTGQHMKVF